MNLRITVFIKNYYSRGCKRDEETEDDKRKILVEIVCGFLVMLGLWIRAAAISLLAVISTAIATAKIPELFRENQVFRFTGSDARRDFVMFCSLTFPIILGGGEWSLHARRLPECNT